MKKTIQIVVVTLAAVVTFSMVANVEAVPTNPSNLGVGLKDGDMCTSTSGLNKGKVGTYENGWCKGSGWVLSHLRHDHLSKQAESGPPPHPNT